MSKSDFDVMKQAAEAAPTHVTLQQMHDFVIEQQLSGKTHVEHYLSKMMETEAPFIVESLLRRTIDEELTKSVITCAETIEWHNIDGSPKEVSFPDIPLGIGNFRSWVLKQQRNQHLPQVPCDVTITGSGESGRLIVFNQLEDCWHIWNDETQSMGEYSRNDFKVIETSRCLPAPIRLKSGAQGIALRQSHSEGVYWVSIDGTVTSSIRLTVGTDFQWQTTSFYDPVIHNHQEPAFERGPEMVMDTFNTDSSYKFQTLSDSIPLPSSNCQDWAMREFFSKKSQQSIWPFIKFFQLQIETDTLYHVYFLDKSSHTEWAIRAQKHVEFACRWFWEQMGSTQTCPAYDNMVWHTKLAGRQYTDETYHFIMSNIYGY